MTASRLHDEVPQEALAYFTKEKGRPEGLPEISTQKNFAKDIPPPV
jgi:hypothetical protein